MAVGAGEQNSPVSRGLARSTAPLERQGRAALEEDPAEESPAAPGGEQVERSAGVDARLHHGVYGAQSNKSVSGSSDRPRIQHRRLSLSRTVSVPYIRLVRAQYEKDGAGTAVSTDSLERIVMLLM